MRNPFRRRKPSTRTVTVTLTADTTAFTDALRRAADSLAQVDFRVIERATRRFADHMHIHNVAMRERVLARAYLDDLVDDAYARYGLTRGDTDA